MSLTACPDCRATVPPCRHEDWCPTLEVNRLRAALQQVVEECSNRRFGMPSYELTLDHLYDVATSALETDR